jgi:hypothetical protein
MLLVLSCLTLKAFHAEKIQRKINIIKNLGTRIFRKLKDTKNTPVLYLLTSQTTMAELRKGEKHLKVSTFI